MIRPSLYSVVFVAAALLSACDQFGTQQSGRQRSLSAAELGKRPPLPQQPETKDNADRQFVSLVDESGNTALGRIKANTVVSVGADEGLGLDELSCTAKVGTEVDVIGLEKASTPGEGFYLVQLREPCKVGSVILSEVYIAEADIKIIESPDVLYPSTNSTTSTSTSIGETASTGCTEISQTRRPTIASSSDSSTSTATATSIVTSTASRPSQVKSIGPQNKISAQGGVCNGQGCVMPGEAWRAGAKDYALRIRGSASKFEFSFNNSLVNGDTTKVSSKEDCHEGGQMPAPKAAEDKGNFAGGKPARQSGSGQQQQSYNCAKIPNKTLVAAAYKQADTGDYLIPYTDLISANDWRGVQITISVKAMDDKDTVINTCEQKTRLASPIVLDFTGSASLDSVALVDSQVRFDLLGNGKRLRSGWVSGDRGFLAIDLNRDGLINDGRELFGEGTRLLNQPGLAENGYEALRQYDQLSRGYIDSKNPVYQQLLVWFDRNQDGISQPQEIASLAQLGVTRIDTAYHEAPQYAGEKEQLLQNQVRWRSQFFDQKNCRKGCYSYDVYFATEHASYMSAIQVLDSSH